MHSALRRRTLVALALAALLAILPSAALGQSRGASSGSRVDAAFTGSPVLGSAWRWLTGLWPSIGCKIDPNGSSCGPQGSAGAQAGCMIDPNGVVYCGSSQPGVTSGH